MFHELLGERRFVLARDRGREADVMEETLGIVKSEQQRPDDVFALVVAETSDYAVRAAIIFDFLHAGSLTGKIRQVSSLGDDTVERVSGAFQPTFGDRKPSR